jgi:hypothetical protein
MQDPTAMTRVERGRSNSEVIGQVALAWKSNGFVTGIEFSLAELILLHGRRG